MVLRTKVRKFYVCKIYDVNYRDGKHREKVAVVKNGMNMIEVQASKIGRSS